MVVRITGIVTECCMEQRRVSEPHWRTKKIRLRVKIRTSEGREYIFFTPEIRVRRTSVIIDMRPDDWIALQGGEPVSRIAVNDEISVMGDVGGRLINCVRRLDYNHLAELVAWRNRLSEALKMTPRQVFGPKPQNFPGILWHPIKKYGTTVWKREVSEPDVLLAYVEGSTPEECRRPE